MIYNYYLNKNKRKASYLYRDYENNKLLDSGDFTIGQTRRALEKCWKGYKIGKSHDNKDEMLLYARRIRKLQRDLKISVSMFPDLDLGIVLEDYVP